MLDLQMCFFLCIRVITSEIGIAQKQLQIYFEHEITEQDTRVKSVRKKKHSNAFFGVNMENIKSAFTFFFRVKLGDTHIQNKP